MIERGPVKNRDMAWSIQAARQASHKLASAGLISWDDLDRVQGIVAEEILVNLTTRPRRRSMGGRARPT